jgi:uncharacterized integral membrane protein
MFYVKILVGLFLFVLAVIFLVQNNEAMMTAVHFKLNIPHVVNLQSTNITLYIIIPLSFLLGALIMWLLCIREHLRLKAKIKSLMTSSKEKEKELNSFRNLPLTSDDVSTSHGLASISQESEEDS